MPASSSRERDRGRFSLDVRKVDVANRNERRDGRAHRDFASVDAARGAGLADDDLRQLWNGRLEFVPDPASDVLARRVLETLDLVQVVVVEAA